MIIKTIQKTMKIRTKLILTVSVALVLGFIFAITMQVKSFNSKINDLADVTLKSAKTSYENVLEAETKKLSVALDLLMNDNNARQYFINNEKDSLYDYINPVFEMLKKKYSITRWWPR